MPTWSFLTNHARALLYIAEHADARLRDIADELGVTERTAYGLVVDLTEAGYVTKEREGRRNRYSINGDLPLPETTSGQGTIGEVLDLLAASRDGRAQRTPERRRRSRATT